MSGHGLSLDQYLHKIDYKISLISVCNIGLSMIDNLELIHSAGYVHNGIKPEHILLDDELSSNLTFNEKNCFEGVKMRLVSYGNATKYLI